MPSQLTRRLVVAATLVTSLLASGIVHRGAIEMPAWQQTGSEAWAAFSRHADVTFPALIIYPLEAFTGAILSIATVLSFRRDGSQPRPAALPVYAAALMTIGGLLATTQAAPIMLSVRDLNDVDALQRALNGFQFWGNIRGIFQFLAFVANLWSTVAILSAGQTAAKATVRKERRSAGIRA